jgi:propanediol dehydratase small subunit
MAIRQPASINDIRTAIRELALRAEVAHKEGREQDAAELERRAQAYRDGLSKRR